MNALRSTAWLTVLVAAPAAPARGGVPVGRDATERTRADAAALRAIQRKGDVLFAEGFESAGWAKRFYDHRGLKDGRLALDDRPGFAARGRSALRCRLGPGKGAVASACLWFGRGYDKVHLRWYCRFGKDFDQGNLMHLVGLAAVASPRNRYAGMGKAGVRPTGYDRFTTGFEPWRAWGRHRAPGAMGFYSYFPAMHEDPRMKGKFWGNMFRPAKVFVPQRGRWHCFEIMLKANDPDKANGEQAAWIDGKLYAHFTGILWRRSAKVKIRRMYLGVYVHNNPRRNTVWFDDVVLSTGYIGPAKARRPKRPHSRRTS